MQHLFTPELDAENYMGVVQFLEPKLVLAYDLRYHEVGESLMVVELSIETLRDYEYLPKDCREYCEIPPDKFQELLWNWVYMGAMNMWDISYEISVVDKWVIDSLGDFLGGPVVRYEIVHMNPEFKDFPRQLLENYVKGKRNGR